MTIQGSFGFHCFAISAKLAPLDNLELVVESMC